MDGGIDRKIDNTDMKYDRMRRWEMEKMQIERQREWGG
jgi:hypothetical protein